MNPKITLAEFLKISRSVTDNYIKAWDEWPITDQWKKIKEEEKEFDGVEVHPWSEIIFRKKILS